MEKKFSWKKFWILAGTHAGVALLAVCTTLLISVLTKDPRMQKLEQIADYIEEFHVDNPDMTTVYDYAAAAMVAGTGDRWSYYISASEMESYKASMENSYVGIGITVREREDEQGIDVVSVTPGGPSQEAGVMAGDMIIAVDGASVQEASVSELSACIKGEAGTSVKLTVRRDDKTLEFTIQRRMIEVPVAEGKLLPDGVGYIKIANFNEKCAAETIAAIEKLLSQGAEYLVFDVRGNPGGYKDELVQVLDYLLPEGNLFKCVDYRGVTEVDTSDARCLRIPMAVLINGESYSAAEFFAAALEEYGWAITGGEQTVGKGHMQTSFELADGSAVGLSIGKYYTPKGVSLADQGGLTPQIQVPMSEKALVQLLSGTLEPEDDEQLQAVIAVLTGKSQEKP